MQERSTSSLALELIKRARLPSLPTVYWLLRIGLLIVGFAVITNWNEILNTVGTMFSGQVSEAVEVLEANTQEVKTTVDDGLDAIAERQRIMQESLDSIEGHKQEIIEEIHKVKEQPRQTPRTTSSTVQIIEAKPLKIAPTTPLSDDDIIVEEQRNDSLYVGERQSTTLQPSSLE